MGADDERTRVLWLAKGLGPGGMERLLVHHARFADTSRFEYLAAYLVERPGSVVPELQGHGVRCMRLGGGGRADVRWPIELRRLVDRERIDVVHAHSPLAAAMARPVLRAGRNRARLVYTEHNTWDCYGRVTRYANLATYGLDDAQFAVSADAAASPPALLRRGVEVLTHGIDLDAVRDAGSRRASARESLGVDDEEVLVVCVAHLRREKGHDVLLDAAARVTERDRRTTFVVVGHGPLAEDLASRRDQLGLGDRFRYLGFRDDAVDLIAASDVFVLSSRQEGLPVAYMESAALGRPAVVTGVGGLPDVVTPDTGVLVEPERPDVLADALERLVLDRSLRERLGAGAARSAEQFDARAAVRRQESVYARLVG